ncbi:hypothetical protein [Devosia sp.]|uniref:hypothetical protein n=1 Tax=Devosia sp. TaxID=1871048 RepID=UPI0032662975
MHLPLPAKMVATVLFAALLTGVALGEDVPLTRDGDALKFLAAGQTLSMPLPEWLSADDLKKTNIKPLLTIAYTGDKSDAQVEIFPKGESQKDWKTRYGAHVLVHVNEPLQRFRDALIVLFSRTCPKAQTGFFQTEPDDGEKLATLGFICAAYDAAGPLAGQGEVALLQFHKTDKGVGVVYQDWRGASFDAAKPATWPISTEALAARAAQFKAAIALSATE